MCVRAFEPRHRPVPGKRRPVSSGAVGDRAPCRLVPQRCRAGVGPVPSTNPGDVTLSDTKPVADREETGGGTGRCDVTRYCGGGLMWRAPTRAREDGTDRTTRFLLSSRRRDVARSLTGARGGEDPGRTRTRRTSGTSRTSARPGRLPLAGSWSPTWTGSRRFRRQRIAPGRSDASLPSARTAGHDSAGGMRWSATNGAFTGMERDARGGGGRGAPPYIYPVRARGRTGPRASCFPGGDVKWRALSRAREGSEVFPRTRTSRGTTS